MLYVVYCIIHTRDNIIHFAALRLVIKTSVSQLSNYVEQMYKIYVRLQSGLVYILKKTVATRGVAIATQARHVHMQKNSNKSPAKSF